MKKNLRASRAANVLLMPLLSAVVLIPIFDLYYGRNIQFGWIAIFCVPIPIVVFVLRTYHLVIEDDKLYHRRLFSYVPAYLSHFEGTGLENRSGSRLPIPFAFWTDRGLLRINTWLLYRADADELKGFFEQEGKMWKHKTYRPSPSTARLTLVILLFLSLNLRWLLALILPPEANDIGFLAVAFLCLVTLAWMMSVRIKLFEGKLYYHSLFSGCIVPLSHLEETTNRILLFKDENNRRTWVPVWGLTVKEREEIKKLVALADVSDR